MEIKSINTSQKISKVHTATKNELGFEKGEIIFARIVSIDGEIITLKARDDTLFTAKIFSELELAVGDDLKLAVKGRQGDKLVMQALSVNPDVVETPLISTQQPEESKLILLIVNLLKKYGIEPTSAKINEIAAGMEKNHGLDLKTAVFMAVNEMAFTEENVEIIKQLESGNAMVSNRLLEILGQMIISEAFPGSENPEAALELLGESLPFPEAPHMPESRESTAPVSISVDPERNFYSVSLAGTPGRAQSPEAAPSAETGIPEAFGEAGYEAETVREAQTVKNIITWLFKSGVITDFENTQDYMPEGGDASYDVQNISHEKAVQEILTKIFAIFARVKDLENGGRKIKTENERKMQALLELKETLKNSDIKNRDVLAEKLDKLISQSRLVSEINRYTLLHIPLNMGREQKTAEIYIYKRKKKGGKTDAQEIKILIGLDTENLGRFEVLITAKDKSLSIKMARGEDRANEVIALRARKLKKTFAELGYSLSDFKIERLREKTTPANAEEVLTGGVSPSSFKINYTI